MKTITLFSLFLMISNTVYSVPMINEISAGGSSDWIELTISPETESCDISQYFVTMYYGTNEKIASSPATIRNRDLPGTPYDDRFAVVHFTPLPVDDETDSTGDTNRNGILDLYCCNYGLWNTDCVVSIDSDDIETNGGMIDFIAFSNRDGSINSTMNNYITAAVTAGQWEACSTPDNQPCTVDAGKDGLNSYSTLSRIKGEDTNTLNDFRITPYATPGKENIINASKGSKGLFRTASKKTTHHYGSGSIKIPLFLYETCSLKLRLFNSTGSTIYSSELKENITPGDYSFLIPDKKLRGRITTGLYFIKIEAAGKNSKSENALINLVIAVTKK